MNYNYKLLSKDFSFVSQVNQPHTIYEIRDIFSIHNFTIPNDCILKFTGGLLVIDEVLTGNNTKIECGLYRCFSGNINLKGTWSIREAYPQWFGAIGDGENDDTFAIRYLFANANCYNKISFPNMNYLFSNIDITKQCHVDFNGSYLICSSLKYSQNFFTIYADNCIIENFIIDGNSESISISNGGHTFAIYGNNNIFRNGKISNSVQDSFWLYAGLYNGIEYLADNTLIENTVINYPGRNGVMQLYDSQTFKSSIIIRGCHFYNINGVGEAIQLSYCKNVLSENNFIKGWNVQQSLVHIKYANIINSIYEGYGDDDTNTNDHLDLTFSENINISKCLFKNRPLGIAINPSNTSKKTQISECRFYDNQGIVNFKNYNDIKINDCSFYGCRSAISGKNAKLFNLFNNYFEECFVCIYLSCDDIDNDNDIPSNSKLICNIHNNVSIRCGNAFLQCEPYTGNFELISVVQNTIINLHQFNIKPDYKSWQNSNYNPLEQVPGAIVIYTLSIATSINNINLLEISNNKYIQEQLYSPQIAGSGIHTFSKLSLCDDIVFKNNAINNIHFPLYIDYPERLKKLITDYYYESEEIDLSSGNIFNARCMSIVNSLNTPLAIYISYTENSSNDIGTNISFCDGITNTEKISYITEQEKSTEYQKFIYTNNHISQYRHLKISSLCNKQGSGKIIIRVYYID